ncbi:MAG: hypothetical protein ACE5GD_01480 [Candidatus Geothermarchaeales archaeon]
MVAQRLKRPLTLSFFIGLLSLASLFMMWGFPTFLVGVPPYTLESLTAKEFKGASPLGYKLGYIGTLLMIVAQIYSLRKRTPSKSAKTLGGVRRWLQMHCAADLVAPTLVLIHSGFPYAFKYMNPFRHINPAWGLRGLIGVAGLAAWLTLVSTLSGFFGRHLYARLDPRARVWFKHWRRVHIALSASLYVTGILHLVIVVWLKIVSAV